MQTETRWPWWAAKLVARSIDQGDKTSKSQIVPKMSSDTARLEGVHKITKGVQGEGARQEDTSACSPLGGCWHMHGKVNFIGTNAASVSSW